MGLFSWVSFKKGYKIFNGSTGKGVKISKVIDRLETSNVLIFGEEHNDSIAHVLELEFLTSLHKKFGKKTVLSLEMFDSDVQPIMDEYLSGLITQKYFEKDARVWSNYNDYKPLIEFAKRKGLDVICANASFRYANLVSNHGMDSLMQLPQESLKFLPPLPYKKPSVAYRTKIETLMGDYMKKGSANYDLMMGQALWNASMSYRISEKLKSRPEAKIFHVNGKLHSDHFLGLPEHLQEYNKSSSIIVVSSSKEDQKKQDGLADYTILTD